MDIRQYWQKSSVYFVLNYAWINNFVMFSYHPEGPKSKHFPGAPLDPAGGSRPQYRASGALPTTGSLRSPKVQPPRWKASYAPFLLKIFSNITEIYYMMWIIIITTQSMLGKRKPQIIQKSQTQNKNRTAIFEGLSKTQILDMCSKLHLNNRFMFTYYWIIDIWS